MVDGDWRLEIGDWGIGGWVVGWLGCGLVGLWVGWVVGWLGCGLADRLDGGFGALGEDVRFEEDEFRFWDAGF